MLLGHTLDDQAETVLLGLTRGSGARSLAGMRRSFGVFRRPLLDLTRAQTEQACRAQDIALVDRPGQRRPAVHPHAGPRTVVLPLLEGELGPGVAAALARTADLLRADVELLDDLAESAYAALPEPLPVATLLTLRPGGPHPRAAPGRAARRRPRRRAVPRARPCPRRAADRLARAGSVDLPGPVRGVRRDGALVSRGAEPTADSTSPGLDPPVATSQAQSRDSLDLAPPIRALLVVHG